MITKHQIYQKFRPRKNKIILIWLSLLLLSPLFLNSTANNGSSNQNITTLTKNNENINDNTNYLATNQIEDVDPFENPLLLAFAGADQNNYQIASRLAILEHGKSIVFKFSANAGQSIDIEINVTGDLPETLIFTDIFSGPNVEYVDTIFQEFPGSFPIFFHYQVPIDGEQYLQMFLDGPISPINIGLTVIRTLEGSFSSELKTIQKTFQSNSYIQINEILEYLVDDAGYISSDGLFTLDLGDFDENSTNVGKAVATSIFGLLRAGELVASEVLNGEVFDPNLLNERFNPFFSVSVELLKLALDNLLHPTGGLFFEGSVSNSTTPEYEFTLETNVYMLMAMLEVWNFYQHFDYQTDDLFLANILLNQINQTMLDIDTVFHNNTIEGYVEIATLDNDDNLSARAQGSKVYLAANALLGEVAYGVLSANFDATGGAPIDNLINSKIVTNSTTYILNNLVVTTNEGQLGAEYYDEDLSLPSNSSTLISNSLLISLLTPIGARIFPDIELATEISETAIKKFKSQANGLLFDSIMLNMSSTSDHTSTINTINFLASLDRLAEAWKFEDFLTSSALDISRTWSKAVRDLQNSYSQILFDGQTNSYFAQYDHDANLFIKNDNDILSNDFIANTAIFDLLAKTFPVRVVMTAPSNFIVENDAAIIINIQQIKPLRKSWLWFLPERNYTVEAKIIIPQHEVTETEDIDLSTFDFDSGFVDVIFTPIKKGNFEAIITLSVEGDTLLTGTLDLVAFGIIYLDYDQSEFETTTDVQDFEPTISIFDESGKAVSNLDLTAVIVNQSQNLNTANLDFKVDVRTDSSGKATLDFDISDIQYRYTAFSTNERPILELSIFINVTNAHNLKYSSPIFIVPLLIERNFLEIHTSPEDPEIIVVGKNLLQIIDLDVKLTPVTIQVTTQDIFGKSVTADSVSIDWAEGVDTDVDIFTEATSFPATFSIDPTDLDPGSYEIEIRVQEEGFTRGEGYISIFRTLTIESPSLIDSAAAAILVFGGLIAGKMLGVVFGIARSRTRGESECPNCGKSTESSQNACQHCGNLMPGKTLWIKDILGLSKDDSSIENTPDIPAKPLPETKSEFDRPNFGDTQKDKDPPNDFDNTSFGDTPKDNDPPSDF